MAAPLDGGIEDDDFGEFGGFEAAEPPVMQQDNHAAQAAPTMWAAMFAPAVQGASNVQPDLLCGQDRFPQHLDNPVTVDVAGSAQASVQSVEYAGQENMAAGSVEPGELRDDNEFDLDNVDLANDILDGSFRSNNQSGAGLQSLNLERMPDISGLDLPAARSNNTSIENSSLDQDNPNVPSTSVHKSDSRFDHMIGEKTSDFVVDWNASLPSQESRPVVRNQGAGDAVVEDTTNNSLLRKAREEKSALEKELAQQKVENSRLSEDLARAHELAEAARNSYEELQGKHKGELDNLRAAGHDSLCLIVQEYKALLKATVQQHQEMGEQRLTERLKEESEKWIEKMDRQKQEFENSQEELKKKNRENLKEIVNEMKEKQKEQFERFLEHEKLRLQQELQAEIQKERQSSASELERLIKLGQEKTGEILEKQQEMFAQKMAVETEKLKTESETALKQQQEKYEELLRAAVEQERTCARESVAEVTRQVREDMNKYLQEQREADRSLQRRQLASLDLFLESARHQLALLMGSGSTEIKTREEDRGEHS